MFSVKNCQSLKFSHLKRFLKNYVRDFKRNSVSVNLDNDPSTKWLQPAGFDTGIKVFNPILKDKVDLILKNKDVATWYSCGPTVYDSAHIGHASCYMKFDIIRRILQEWFNINVIYVMGITDIDDKIIKKANESNIDYKNVSQKYEIEFLNDMQNLNILPPSLFARVTDYIPNIINFIDKIITEGYAYTGSTGSVYFKTTEFSRYDKFGLASVDKNILQDTHDIDDIKASPSDFALWKAAKPGEPSWSSPWGPGRPGWHIECSAIASAVFGNNIDIHSGGIDLKFPHHENEEAQSCAYHCVDQWINYWLHSGHLRYKGGEKMSKSLKNTLTIDDFLQKFSANDLRVLCLMSPYRKGIEYSDEAITTASAVYRKIESFIHTCDAYVKGQSNRGVISEEILLKELAKTKDLLHLSFSDDFNTPQAFSYLMELISTTNGMINEKCENIVRNPFAVAAVSNFVKETFSRLGLNLELNEERSSDTSIKVSSVLDTAVNFRCQVRQIIQSTKKNSSEDAKVQKKKLFESCDDFRNSLSNIGIELQDHGEKCSWKLKESIQEEKSTNER